MIETTPADSGLQATVESLLEDRPDLMDPKRLQLFQRILESQIETRRPLHGHADGRPVRPAKSPPSKFMAAVMYLCGAYLTVMSVALPFPKVPMAILPILAAIGFFGTRYWVRRSE